MLCWLRLRSRLGLGSILSLVLAAGAVAASPAQLPRQLLVRTPSVEDPRFLRQAGWLVAVWRGLRERDLEIAVQPAAGGTFEVVLIGRDGGEKLRANAPVPPAELFALIDTMPMRRAEMAAEAGR